MNLNPKKPERTIEHGQTTGKLYHLVIGLYELLGNQIA